MARGRVPLVPLVAIIAAACHGASSSASRSTPFASNSATCPADRLSASFRAEDGSTGHYHAVLVLVNTGATRCQLFATVKLQMLAENGAPTTTRTAVDDSTGRPTPVLLAPSSQASMQVTWVEITSGEPCVMPAALKVIAPNDAHALVVPWPADHDVVCGHGVLTIQPARLGVPRV